MGFQLTLNVWKFSSFRNLFLAGLLTSVARWFEFLTFAILTWKLTANTSMVGYIMTSRFFFLALTGFYFSAKGSQYSGQKIIILFTGICSVSCFLIFLSYYLNFEFELLGLFLISSISGALWSVDFSFRRRMLADSLPDYLISSGVSMDVLSTHATRLIGPFIGGVFLVSLMPELIFLFLGILYMFSTFLILPEKDKNIISNNNIPSMLLFSEVLSEVSKKTNLIAVILLTPLFNIFGLPFLSLVGILIIEKFSTNSFYSGMIVSLEGLGALIGGILISAFPPKRKLLLFCLMLLCLFLFISLLSITSNLLIFILLLFFAGFVTSSYSALQSSIIYLNASPHIRSSTFSLLTIAIGTGSIGTLNISLMSNYFSTKDLTLIMGVEGIVSFILIASYLKLKHNLIQKL